MESHVHPVEDAAAEPLETSGVVVVKNSNTVLSKPPPIVKRVSWRDRILRDNGVVRSFTTETPSPESLDGAISALSLLSGLMLTIPYSLMSTMTWEYWDRVQEITSPCPASSEKYKRNMRLALTVTIYCSCGTLILSTFYFLFKPRDVAQWWKRGRFFLLMLVVLTVATVVSLLAVSRMFLNWSVMTSGEICDTFPSLNVAQALLVLVAFGGLLIFF